MTDAQVGHRIRRARQRAGLSQREVARRSGVPQPHISAIEAGRVVPTEAMMTRLLDAARLPPSALLDRHRREVRELIASRGGTRPRVFGSVATGRDTKDSDLDLLVAFRPGTSIFDLVGLGIELEEVLGVHVDVVGDDGEGVVLARARRDAVPL